MSLIQGHHTATPVIDLFHNRDVADPFTEQDWCERNTKVVIDSLRYLGYTFDEIRRECEGAAVRAHGAQDITAERFWLQVAAEARISQAGEDNTVLWEMQRDFYDHR